MSNLPLNLVDLGVFGVILISALLAFSRGLVREVLSIGAWVLAALATIYGLPHLTGVAQMYIKSLLVAQVITGTTIFIVTLIFCAAISHMVARNVRSSGFGAVDRSLGLLFGVLRGMVLVCLAYLAFAWAEPNPEDQPAVVKNARTLRYVEQGAELLHALLPKGTLERGAAAAADAKAQVEQAVTQQLIPGQTVPAVAPDQPKDTAPANDPGYNNPDRKGLDQLIKSNQ